MAACLGAGLIWSSGPPGPAMIAVALVCLGAGAICGSAGALALGRNLTPFPGPGRAGTLVQTGVYGLMRHPLYTAVTCAALGWALLRVSWPAGLATAALFVFFNLKARYEERLLIEKFPDYTAYARRVKRFIPWIY